MTRHFLEICDLNPDELARVLLLARAEPEPVLAGRGVALVFEKPSVRTRHSSEMAVVRLGGHPAVVTEAEVGIDRRESAEDVARTLACYHDLIGARVFDHQVLRRMAAALDAQEASVPVVNLLSDTAHPCQAIADLLTLEDLLGPDLRGRRLVYVGDANNVTTSLAYAAVARGMAMVVAAPAGYQLDPAVASSIDAWAGAAGAGGTLELVADPAGAVAGADAVYTDVWVSMGQEAEAATRREALGRYRLSSALLEAAPGAAVLHCLPAHRGEEIDDDVVEGPNSAIWRQARHRYSAMLGLLRFLAEEGALR